MGDRDRHSTAAHGDTSSGSPTVRAKDIDDRRLGLLVIGEGLVITHTLPSSGTVVIGRSRGVDVRVDLPSVSRRHAAIHIGPPLSVEDLGSANGTNVGDATLSKGQTAPLHVDELVDLGGVIAIVQSRNLGLEQRRIWSHAYFENRLIEECARAKDAAMFAVLRIHCANKATESLVERAVFEAVRADDIVGAYAPGEFEALLIGADEQTAQTVADTLVDKAPTASSVRVGIACFPRDGRTADRLIASAGASALETTLSPGDDEARLITQGNMRGLQELVTRIAAGDISVLILGETGVGKEVMAETIHRLSRRRDRKFLRLNCAALSESLLESELFGHERGAFTGAVNAKPGLLETADGGTVFLDEIGELPMSMQVKLLRVIEDRLVTRVGAVSARPIDVRFIAATNRDLELAMERGAFRSDLYYRLDGVTLVIPPLRERKGEIPELCRCFAAEATSKVGASQTLTVSDDAMDALQSYDWPGNIRELRNVIERAALLCKGTVIGEQHLPTEKLSASLSRPVVPAPVDHRQPNAATDFRKLPVPAAAEVESLHAQMHDADERLIVDALERCGGNQTQAAKLLNISRRTLLNRLDKYGIPRPRKRK